MPTEENEQISLERIRKYYDSVYYGRTNTEIRVSRHLRKLSLKLGIRKGQKILDVACGLGEWLLACEERGAVPYGIDVSSKAIDVCRTIMPEHEFHSRPAEQLPFESEHFDVVSCLGAVEHFANPLTALKEMVRVAKTDAKILLLVPNADFLARKLGMYSGTDQTDAKEEVRSLGQWKELFEQAGLEIRDKWRDLHILSWKWISLRDRKAIPIRIVQAMLVALLPSKWQYQVYHLCQKKHARGET